ncbi:MAG: hydrogenase formation protein HypD [Candidatus Aminicenantes bacterium]|nr:hydrogenase formation protein HypD [Candidatus Aminicenantes bacterium]
MKELRDKKVIQGLLNDIKKKSSSLPQPLKIMEVCGTHTMVIHRYGLKTMLREAGIEMLSGPGCPVCITPNEIHEAAIDLVTENENFICTTFGDMTRVPTSKGSIQNTVPKKGSQVKIVYSPFESLTLAQKNPRKDVVFFGVGFETTIPAIAVTVRYAAQRKIKNFSLLAALWLIPPPLKEIAGAKDTQIQGFLYPGHVSAIIGEKPYHFIPKKHFIPGAITGFEPGDILMSLSSIQDQIKKSKPIVDNTYSRVVKPNGNPSALKIMDEMFQKKDSQWRGLGLIPESGLRLKDEYKTLDAESKYRLNIQAKGQDLPGCRCGDVLQGQISPLDCPLFSNQCTPDSPQGPCMVSYEGACLAHLKYGMRENRKGSRE